MATPRIIKDIARSLVAIAKKDQVVPQILRNLRDIESAFRKDTMLAVDLDETCISLHHRQNALKHALARDVNPLVLNAVLALQRRGLLKQISALRTAASHEAISQVNHREATIHSANKLSEIDQQKIETNLQKRFGGTVDIVTRTDPSLIGGVLIRIGDQVIDATVTGRLKRLTQTLYV